MTPPADILDSIETVLNYNEADEAADFAVERDELDDESAHVYWHMERVRQWLRGERGDA